MKKRKNNPQDNHNGSGDSDDTRQVAFLTLCQIFERSRSLDVALQHALDWKPQQGKAQDKKQDKGRHKVSQRDKAAAYRLIVCFLRQKGTLEALAEPFLQRPPPNRVLWILLLGIAQLLFLDVPAHAAIDTTVELARKNGFAKFTGLVNAVLRRVMEKGQDMLEELDQERLNLPVWLWQEWNRAGFQPRRLATALTEAPLDITFKQGTSIPDGGNLLADAGSEQHWRYPSGTKVETLAGFQEGQCWVQDIAASLPAIMLNAQKGEKVADLCAAPGGKTAQLVQAGADVVAVEKDGTRLKRLRENLTRLNMRAELIQADAGKLPYKEEFDAILLDAPCSATGIFRRHPDVLHLKKQKDVQGLVDIQRKLVKASLNYLKKGGRLVYSVCSLQPAEAEEQARFIADLEGVTLLPFRPEEIPFLPEALTAEGWIRTLPSMWQGKGGMDGFFMARFIKN